MGIPDLSIASMEDEYKMPQAQVQPTEFDYARRQIVLGLVAAFSIYAVSFYYLQTIGIARPRMAAELNGMPLFSWLISIPGLAGALVTLLFSKFSDIYGRRLILTVSLSFCLLGTILSAVSPTFVTLIIANTITSLGLGALIPLCLSLLGDMFAPAERSKWVGMLNIPGGIFSLCGPTLGGWFVDNLSWRYIYWMGVPLVILCLVAVLLGIPSRVKSVTHKIDILGSALMVMASSSMILALSFAGTVYSWSSLHVSGLLAVSFVLWGLFLWTQTRAAEPLLDPQVFHNRTFLIVLASGALSCFGQTAIMAYYPLFLQGVQGISATQSGQILTPFGALMSFMGVPIGFLLARTKRCKRLFVMSYALLTVVMCGTVFFNTETPIVWGIVIAALGGLGFGAIPTISTLSAQCIVPKRMIGVAMGALFFNLSLSMTIAPAVLGSVMNIKYADSLRASLPHAMDQLVDRATMTSLGNPSVLLLKPAMSKLQGTFNTMGNNGQALFAQTVRAIRASLQSGLSIVFLIGAGTMLLAFLLILAIPEISIDAEVKDEKPPNPSRSPAC
jgi:MFS family permease